MSPLPGLVLGRAARFGSGPYCQHSINIRTASAPADTGIHQPVNVNTARRPSRYAIALSAMPV
jgi:hypothetical protein